MRAPYKVIVVGTGGIGKAVLLEMLRRPEFEIVGIMGFSKHKAGRDVGELLGQKPLGLKISTDKQAMVDLHADCVIWCGYFPMPHLEGPTNEMVIKFLESGKNVISPTCYHFPPKKVSLCNNRPRRARAPDLIISHWTSPAVSIRPNKPDAAKQENRRTLGFDHWRVRL